MRVQDRSRVLLRLVAALAMMGAHAVRAVEPPVPAAVPAAVKAALCGRHACRLEHVARLAAQPDAPLVDVLRWNLCGKAEEVQLQHQLLDTESRPIGRCARAYYRVAWPADAPPEVQLLTVDSNAGSSGYGAGGGGESVSVLPDGRLQHDIEGGSSSRWRVVKTWGLQLQAKLLSEVRHGIRIGLFESEREWHWDAADEVKRFRGTETACRFDAKSKRWALPDWGDNGGVSMSEAAKGADMPTLKQGHRFDWRAEPMPDWLELRADAKPGRQRYSVVVTRAPVPDSDLAVRLLRLHDGSVVVEWQGLDGALAAQHAPRLELWWSEGTWSHGEFGRCVLPQDARIRAFSTDGQIQRALRAYQVLIQLDGTVQSAHGHPMAAGWRVTVDRAHVGGNLRWRLRWRSPYAKQREDDRYLLPPSYAVALSTVANGRQHLVSHADLRFADPSSFIEMQGLDATPDDEWRQALAALAKARADERTAHTSKSGRQP